MAKRSQRSLSKKWMPKNAVRGMGENGKRVWKWNGKEFLTLRELIYRINPTEKDAS